MHARHVLGARNHSLVDGGGFSRRRERCEKRRDRDWERGRANARFSCDLSPSRFGRHAERNAISSSSSSWSSHRALLRTEDKGHEARREGRGRERERESHTHAQRTPRHLFATSVPCIMRTNKTRVPNSFSRYEILNYYTNAYNTQLYTYIVDVRNTRYSLSSFFFFASRSFAPSFSLSLFLSLSLILSFYRSRRFFCTRRFFYTRATRKRLPHARALAG